MLMTNPEGRMAKLRYLANDFRIMAHGDYVLCAVSAAPIPLEALRYWSVEKQEAYATPELATEAALKR